MNQKPKIVEKSLTALIALTHDLLIGCSVVWAELTVHPLLLSRFLLHLCSFFFRTTSAFLTRSRSAPLRGSAGMVIACDAPKELVKDLDELRNA